MEKNLVEELSTHELRAELLKREVEERKKDAVNAASQAADEGLALVVDTYYETLEKVDPSLEENREHHDERLVASLRAIIGSYWSMNRETWKASKVTMHHSRPANFNDLAAAMVRKPSV